MDTISHLSSNLKRPKSPYTIETEIGGIAKALMIIGYFICMPINKLKFHLQLSNSLFRFNNDETSKSNQQKNVEGQKLIQLIEVTQQLNKSTKSQNYYLKQPSLPNILSQEYDDEEENTIKKQLKQSTSPGKEQKIKFNDLLLTRQLTPQQSPIENQYLKQLNSLPNINEDQSEENKKGLNFLHMIKMSKQLRSTLILDQQQESSKKLTNFTSQDKSIQKEIAQKIEQPEETKLDLSWYEYIKYYTWPWGKFQQKKKQIDYSMDKVYQHLDILNIVQKLLEIEKLKQILLDEDQIKLVQFLPQPLINLGVPQNVKEKNPKDKKSQDQQQYNQKVTSKKQSKSISLLNSIEVNEKLKAKQAYQALQNIIKKERLTDLDRKIIELLDDQIILNMENNADFLNNFEENDKEVKAYCNIKDNLAQNQKSKTMKNQNFQNSDDSQSNNQNKIINNIIYNNFNNIINSYTDNNNKNNVNTNNDKSLNNNNSNTNNSDGNIQNKNNSVLNNNQINISSTLEKPKSILKNNNNQNEQVILEIDHSQESSLDIDNNLNIDENVPSDGISQQQQLRQASYMENNNLFNSLPGTNRLNVKPSSSFLNSQ